MQSYRNAAKLGRLAVITLLAVGPGRLQAQSSVIRIPLTVRPRTMATGMQNPAAGEYALDSLPVMSTDVREHPYLVYVPKSCAGAHRCPLLLFLHGASQSSRQAMDWSEAADKYGLIILGATAVTRQWTVGVADSATAAETRTSLFDLQSFESDRKNIDAALQQVLRKFAIDPAKIILSGFSQGCWPARILVSSNMDVFSRVVWWCGLPSPKMLDRSTPTTEFLEIGQFPYIGNVMEEAAALRRGGYRAEFVQPLAKHNVYLSTADFAGRWLQESWAQPDPAKRTAPRVLDSLPVLTPQALTQLTSVWQAASALREAGRLPYLQEVSGPILKMGGSGTEPFSAVMVDLSAVAARVPAVAAALQAAGLTAAQFDSYRLALLSAILTERSPQTQQSRLPRTAADSASVLGQNVAFVQAHAAEVEGLYYMFSDGS